MSRITKDIYNKKHQEYTDKIQLDIEKKRTWAWWKDNNKLVKLEQAFGWGATDEEAVFYAEISADQLYYCSREINPDFQVRKESLKKNPVLLARKSVVEAIPKDSDLALRYLERKASDEFATKSKQEHGGEVISALVDMLKKIKDEKKSSK